MIAGGLAMGAAGHEAVTPERAPVGTGWDRARHRPPRVSTKSRTD